MNCRRFCWAVSVICWSLFLPNTLFAGQARGGQVEWARLQTHYSYWSRHVEKESYFLNFLQENTTLNISSGWSAADLYDLKSLAKYPFLYAEGIQTVTDHAGQNNLREYLMRGGFLVIDACINPEVNPDPDVFFEGQIQRFHEIFPKAIIRPLAGEHEIYRTVFNIKKLPHAYMNAIYDPRWAKYPLYSVEMDGRTISIISLSGLKCGWSFAINDQALRIECMRMLVNIYAFALMQ